MLLGQAQPQSLPLLSWLVFPLCCYLTVHWCCVCSHSARLSTEILSACFMVDTFWWALTYETKTLHLMLMLIMSIHMTVFYTSLFMIFKSFCLALWAARQTICLPWVDMYSKFGSSFFPNKANRQMSCSLGRFFLTTVFQGHFTCGYVFFSLHTYKESSLSVK